MKKRLLLLILSVFFLSSCMDLGMSSKDIVSISVKLKDGITVYQGDNFNKYKEAFIMTIHYEDGSTRKENPLKYFSEFDEGLRDLRNIKGFYTDTLGKKTATFSYEYYDYDHEFYSATLDFEVKPAEYVFYNGEFMSYNGSDPNFIIPSTINGQTVTKIGYGAFKGKNITSVTIPETVKTISPYAFAYNKNLKSITLPSSLTKIAEYCFFASSLESITIPQSVVAINKNAFQFNKLSTVVLSDSLKYIESEAFSSNKLTALTLPSTLKIIGEKAFERNLISNIIIPQGVITIKDNAFLFNTIDKVTIPSSVEELGWLSFYSSRDYTKIKELTIPTKFKDTINNYFYDTPESITYID